LSITHELNYRTVDKIEKAINNKLLNGLYCKAKLIFHFSNVIFSCWRHRNSFISAAEL